MALWRARDVEVLITSSSASASSAFSSATAYEGYFKTVELKEPERGTGEQKLLGATSGNANSEVWEEDPGTAELTGEMILSPTNGATVDINEVFYTYTSDKMNFASDPSNPSMMIRFGGGTNFIAFILQDVQLNSLGGVSVDADGHASAEIKVTCAANKTFKEKGGTQA